MGAVLTGEPSVARLKEYLRSERGAIEALHRGGALGAQVCSAIADLYDRVITLALEERLRRLGGPDLVSPVLALVAVGGYGRGDLAPFSDVDLLVLHRNRPPAPLPPMVSSLVRDLWDVGLKLGHSVRTLSDAMAFARSDLNWRTSLMEARLVAGSAELFAELQGRVRRFADRLSINRFIDELLRERAREHHDYFAPTVNLLEPDVKKSPGALRDAHLVRWIAFARYGTADADLLRSAGVLTDDDDATLRAATEFLYRVRHELHWHRGAAQDVLTREEQVRVARELGYAPQGRRLGVELFMQQVYRHTTALQDVALRFAEGARRRSGVRRWIGGLLTQRVEGDFLLGRERLSIDPAAAARVLGNAEKLVRLVDLARWHGVKISHETMERVRAASPACPITPAAREAFRRMIDEPHALGLALRDLHRIGLLGRLVPAFEHAHCLMQFNQYHKYTVDEHSIRAVEAAVERVRDDGPIGQAYRQTRDKAILHLAILLHDVGKGFEEDHSEVGRRIAEETAALLGLGQKEREQLVFLVHRHLLMAHTALRRDVSDLRTIVEFVRKVGTLETLRMLTVLTVADTEAVAPGNLTGWKESLVTELYLRAAEELTGQAPVADEKSVIESLRDALRAKVDSEFPPEWLDGQLGTMPLSYLQFTDPETIVAHLRIQRTLGPRDVRVETEFLRDEGLTRYTVFAHDALTPGLFSKIAGALAAARVSIVSARIVTRADGRVVDTFFGVDLEHPGGPPDHRRQEIADQIRGVLLGQTTVEDLFARRGHAEPGPRPGPAGPTQVEVDNASSDRFTVVEVFADDRPGLLYRIARAIFELGLSVSSARISTRLDQVVDVFYVTDAGGGKVMTQQRLDQIRARILEAIERPA
jgi:[protein-PII] uridylyltransferase